MVQGSGQMGEVLGRRRRRRHLEIQVWNSFSFRAWIGLIWEISAHPSVHPAWNFGARLFWKNPKNTWTSHFQYFQDIRKFQETCSKNNPIQHNTTPGAARPPPVFPGYQAIRKTRFPIFPGDHKIRKIQFPIYVQATRKLEKNDFQYFQDMRKYKYQISKYFQAGNN